MIINSNTTPRRNKEGLIVNDLKKPTQTVVPEEPMPSDPLKGPIYYKVAENNRYFWNGEEWVLLGGIQADWNQEDETKADFIKNKPTIPVPQVQADWNATSGMGRILNKPKIDTEIYQGYAYYKSNGSFLKITRSDGSYFSRSESGMFLTGEAIRYVKIQEYIVIDNINQIGGFTDERTVSNYTGIHYSGHTVTDILQFTRKRSLKKGDILLFHFTFNKQVSLLNIIEAESTAMQDKTITNDQWDLNYGYQTLSTLQKSSNFTLVLDGTTEEDKLKIVHIVRIDNTSASNIIVTLSKGSNVGKIRCLSNNISIPTNNSCELSCYITKESIGGVDRYVANVTEYNGLELN